MVWIRRLLIAALLAFAATTFALGIADEVGAWTDDRAPAATESEPMQGDPGNTDIQAPATPQNESENTSQTPTPSTPRTTPVLSGIPESFVVAYYFHNTHRCVTCLEIERRASEALQGTFPDELANGDLRWVAVNMELPENQHVVFDYDLTSPSLVLVLFKDNLEREHRVLARTWELIHQDQGRLFDSYVIIQTQQMLGELDD
ncbi:hypothetical protein JW848_09360 [Candidatus Bipolaricaulota bacterium]|nr:hypothetical protein [Candidatus Bipolaricaulota bacterium]